MVALIRGFRTTKRSVRNSIYRKRKSIVISTWRVMPGNDIVDFSFLKKNFKKRIVALFIIYKYIYINTHTYV